MKLTKRQKEIIAMCNDGWMIFVNVESVFLSKGYTNHKVQCSLFWRMYNLGIFTQRNGDFYLHDEYAN